MGRDKAGLEVGGVPLWRRQIETLLGTGAVEVFISGKADGPYAGSGVEIVEDEWREAGPLGGIASALKKCGSDWALVLAVDMPATTAEFLWSLAEEAMREEKAVVPRWPNGNWEPLVAVYPTDARGFAERMLNEGKRKMEGLVRELEERGCLRAREIGDDEAKLFENWNEPGDVSPGSTPNVQ
jgi:molybdopterin-guanine dinucleotide biosynthesis protein A